MTLYRLLAGLCLLATTPADATLLRDAHTGLALRGELTLHRADGSSSTVLAQALSALPDQVVAISAPGYRQLELPPAGPSDLPLTLLLSPEHPDPLPEPRSARIRIGGQVVDAQTASPVADARIHWLGAETRSDPQGRWQLDLPAPTDRRESSTASLEVRHPAYPLWIQQRRLDVGSAAWLPIALGSRPGLDHRWQAGSQPPEPLPDQEPARTPTPATPPASIRVGFADAACSVPCCTNSCTNVCVMDFETYVRRGLNDEWIASWPSAALGAGAVAYRAYGAWRQANPIRPNFDLCSSACCQVNDPDTSSSTDAAVAATSGILLLRNGARFGAEYSAENNSWDDPDDGLSCTNTDLSCGDGYAGSPATGWPCLADPVGTGWGCFGHGRGMSQWGTRGWALAGWRWPRIVDHYYNAGGNGSGLRSARMSSPLSAGPPQPEAGSVAPGASLMFRLPVTHQGGAPLPRVMHQSLLRRDASDWPDAGGDTLHTLAPGASLLERHLAVPAELAPGPITLVNRLWLDADSDGRVGSEDLLLLERSDDGLLTIQAADRLHADGFEAQP